MMTREQQELRLKELDLRGVLKARQNILPFTQYTFQGIYKPSFFHKRYAEKLQQFIEGKIKRLIITIPPQHGKSELSSRRMPAYMFGKNPNLRMGLCSYNDSIAGKFNRDIKRIMKSEEYKKVFPKSEIGSSRANYDTDNSTEFTINGHQGDFVSVGVGGSLTSRKLDVAVIDDLYKDWEQANSFTYRETVWNWYTSVLETRLHNDSQVCIIMTRWHADDLVGRIKKGVKDGTIKEKWEEVHYEAIKESPKTEYDPRELGEALWEEMHSKEKLEGQRLKAPKIFNALSQGRPQESKTNKYFEDYSGFDEKNRQRNLDINEIPLNKEFPVICSFDFNKAPCTVTLIQDKLSDGIKVCKTIQSDGGIGKLLTKLQFLKHERYALIIIGDNNGHRGTAETELSCFSQIFQVLGATAEPITHNANWRLSYSGEICNYVFSLDGLLKISEVGNEPLIMDLEKTLSDGRGGILKKAHDPHAGDALRYAIHYLFPNGVEDAWSAFQLMNDIEEQNKELREKHYADVKKASERNKIPFKIKLGNNAK